MKNLLLSALLFLLPLSAFADTISFTWDKVTTAYDGTPLQELLGYRMYVSQTSGVYGASVGSATAESYSYVQPARGIYFATVTAFNSGGESGRSNEVTFIIKPGVPGMPKNLKVTIPSALSKK